MIELLVDCCITGLFQGIPLMLSLMLSLLANISSVKSVDFFTGRTQREWMMVLYIYDDDVPVIPRVPQDSMLRRPLFLHHPMCNILCDPTV